MEIQSTKTPTHHVLVSMMNYVVNMDNPDYGKYGFAYLNIQGVIDEISEISKKNANGKFILNYGELILVESDEIVNATHNESPGFDHIKLDSISFLKSRPEFTGIETKKILGEITCQENWFTVDCEYIPTGLFFPSIIFKSVRIQYSKIEELNKNML